MVVYPINCFYKNKSLRPSGLNGSYMVYWRIGALIAILGINAYLLIATKTICASPNIAMYAMAISLQFVTIIIIFKSKIYTRIANLLNLRKGLFILPIVVIFFSFALVWEAKQGTHRVGGQQYCLGALVEDSF